jgi:hypothetical protein
MWVISPFAWARALLELNKEQAAMCESLRASV